jgi:hypothetical protein
LFKGEREVIIIRNRKFDRKLTDSTEDQQLREIVDHWQNRVMEVEQRVEERINRIHDELHQQNSQGLAILRGEVQTLTADAIKTVASATVPDEVVTLKADLQKLTDAVQKLADDFDDFVASQKKKW